MAKKKAPKKSARKPAKKGRPTRKQAPRAAKKTAAKTAPKEAPRPIGSLTHVQIPAPDLKRATDFYSKILGWKITVMPGMEQYALFDDGGMGGGLNAFPGAAEAGIRPFYKVKDIPATLAQVEALGGGVVQPKTEIPGGMGFCATFSDPNGIKIGLWSAS